MIAQHSSSARRDPAHPSVQACFLGRRALKALRKINHHHLIWTIGFSLLYLNASILGRRLRPASGLTRLLVRRSARRDYRRRSEHQNASN
jgi:hypothetical protein